MVPYTALGNLNSGYADLVFYMKKINKLFPQCHNRNCTAIALLVCRIRRSKETPIGIKPKVRGFTYLAVLFSVAIMSAVLAATGVFWHQSRQREKEQELLFVGNQFRHAIASYYQRTPGTLKRYPQQLEDLLLDTRYLSLQRHLRKIYRDPMTGKTEWGLINAPEGGIMGVHSLSQEAPIKIGNFHSMDTALTGKTSYQEWHFDYTPPVVKITSQPTGNARP